MELEDGRGERLYEALCGAFPDLPMSVSPAQDESSYARVVIPSANPAVSTPLEIELGGFCQLFWNGSYFVDFIGDDPVSEVLEFLRDFFGEKILCCICWRDGKVVGGGPVWNVPTWGDPSELIEIRSWRGNFDQVIQK